jgi:hypothetical protein
LTRANRSKVERANRSIRVTVTHVTGGEGLQHFEKLAPVGPRARHLLAIDIPAAASGGAKLVKLGVERLAVIRAAGGALFLKQIGSNRALWPGVKHRKGENPIEWPPDLQIQDLPRRSGPGM